MSKYYLYNGEIFCWNDFKKRIVFDYFETQRQEQDGWNKEKQITPFDSSKLKITDKTNHYKFLTGFMEMNLFTCY